MELNANKIIKALECCTNCICNHAKTDTECPLVKMDFCKNYLMKQSLALIKELTEEKNEVFEKGAENLTRLEEAYLKLESENIRLIEENERLRAKQTPQKPRNTRREIVCPSCSTLIGSHPYCAYCGQAIDWSKESEGE